MPTYKAEIKTVPTGSSYTVTVESGSMSTARQEIEHLYEPIYIRNLRQVGSESGSDGSIEGTWFLIAILVTIVIAIQFWPITLALLVIWGLYKIFS
jgi:hypothetical protein